MAIKITTVQDADGLKILNAEDPVAFEKLMLEKILPFLSSNALIIGLYALHDLKALASYLLVIPTIVIIALMIFWRVIHRSEPTPLATIVCGTCMVLVSLLLYMTVGGMSYFVLTYAISAVFVYGVLKSFIPQSSIWYYMFYVPFLSGLVFEDTTARLLVTFPIVLALFVVFFKKKMNHAAAASITATVFAGITELFRSEQFEFAFLVLIGAALIGAIIYEIKIINIDVSDFKMFLRQGIFVLLTLILVAAFYSIGDSDDHIAWTWFYIVAFYQAIQIYRSKDNTPARFGWIMCILLICLVSEIDRSNGILICILLTVVALINSIISRQYQSRFQFNISLMYLLVSLYLLLDQSQHYIAPALILLSVLTWACLVYLTGVIHIGHSGEGRWWHGFIKKNDLDTLKHYGEVIIDKVNKVPVVGGVVSLVTSFFNVIKNIKGEKNPLGYLDLIFVISQFFVIEVITNQINRSEVFIFTPAWQRNTVEIAVYIFFGLVLFISGAVSNNLFFRLLAIIVFAYPLAVNTIEDQIFSATTGYLYGVTGILVGVIYALYVSKKVQPAVVEKAPDLQ